MINDNLYLVSRHTGPLKLTLILMNEVNSSIVPVYGLPPFAESALNRSMENPSLFPLVWEEGPSFAAYLGTPSLMK